MLVELDEKGESVTMCKMLDYAEEKGMKRGITQGIQALIEASCEFGQTYEATLEKVMEKFELDPEEANKKMKQYFGN